MLGKLLQLSIEDQNNVDVLDRALFYYRILETGIENAKLIVSKNFSPEKITFQEKDDEQLTETLLDEYNSLSIVYEKPYSQITHNYRILNQEKSDESESESESESENENQNENEKEWGVEQEQEQEQVIENEKKSVLENENENESESENENENENEDSQEETVINIDWECNPQAILLPNDFQKLWAQLTESKQISIDFGIEIETGELIEQLTDSNILTIASGTIQQTIKMFCYAQRINDEEFMLMEIIINNETKIGTINLKSTNKQFTFEFSHYIKTCLI
ncbi:ap-4 complex subunit beta-1 [Anaeramoeba flamelloides]|uniref:Ap-4 complex subunit beta-1 n=1 Tax=Anaeramoeba flamelloides TaxID=1746091 RepID=A0ABQ8Z527_9EUKA|nr:ap-4 complex subunit beta-1 [Anaeramoeba flamelloides]